MKRKQVTKPKHTLPYCVYLDIKNFLDDEALEFKYIAGLYKRSWIYQKQVHEWSDIVHKKIKRKENKIQTWMHHIPCGKLNPVYKISITGKYKQIETLQITSEKIPSIYDNDNVIFTNVIDLLKKEQDINRRGSKWIYHDEFFNNQTSYIVIENRRVFAFDPYIKDDFSRVQIVVMNQDAMNYYNVSVSVYFGEYWNSITIHFK